jgi:hypothetical protein
MINYFLSFTVVRVVIMLAYFTFPWWLIPIAFYGLAAMMARMDDRAEARRWERRQARDDERQQLRGRR